VLKSGIVCATLLAMPAALVAQGTLEPPGPPAPVMKTLQEVEPRTPITSAGMISVPGSYYLANDISGLIQIGSSNVELDLNGFTIRPGDNGALWIAGVTQVRIHNGSIVDTDTENGVAVDGVNINNSGDVLLSDLRFTDIRGDCIDVFSPTGLVTVERVNCVRMQRGGIVIRQFGDMRLDVVVRDNIIVESNLSDDLTIGGILIGQNSANPWGALVTGNTVINPRTWGFQIANAVGATAEGRLTENTVLDCSIGYNINANLLVAKNLSVGCDTSFVLSQNARGAPVTALDASPGAWDNIVE
jgi:hypothetical protein